MKNKMVDLRDHLFTTIERLSDGDIDIETAKLINGVAQTLVHTAQVEVKYLEVTGNDRSEFIQPKALPPVVLTDVRGMK